MSPSDNEMLSDAETPADTERRRVPGDFPELRERLWRFSVASVKKAIDDELTEQSAALAFITILSLVPLLAAFSFLLQAIFDQQEQRMIAILTQVLPYTQQEVVAKIDEFLIEAEKIRGAGLLGFLLATLLTFATIERTINRIWNVDTHRTLRSRLLSFTLILFWGPLLIGAAYSGLYYLESQPALWAVARSLPAQFLPAAITLLGLTMLYWLVPYTAVRFRNALVGGLVATLLLEGLKQGFGFYIESFRRISIIYGSFGLALFFMISIHLAWAIVLLGSEVAYCVQNYRLLIGHQLSAAQLEGRWLGLAALLVVTDRFRRGEPITPHAQLARRLRLLPGELEEALEPLIQRKLLSETGGDDEGYLLSCDPYRLRVDDVLELYEEVQLEVLEPLSEEVTAKLEQLRSQLAEARRAATGELTLAGLLGAGPEEIPEAGAA